MAGKEIKLNAEVKKIEKLVKKDNDEVVSGIGKILKKIFLGLDFEVLEKKVDELKLKERNSLLTDEDKKQLPRLLKIFESKKSEVELKVDKLFAVVVDGTQVMSDAQIKSKAIELIDEVGDSSAINTTRRSKLAEVARDGLVSARKLQDAIKQGIDPLPADKKEAAEWSNKQEKTTEVNNSYKREPQLIALKDVATKAMDNFDNMTVDDLSREMEREAESRAQSKKKIEELLQMGDANRDALKTGMNNSRDEIMIDKISKDQFKDDPIFKAVKAGQGINPKEKRILHEFSGQLTELGIGLRKKQWNQAIDGVQGLNLGRFGITEFKISGVIVDKAVGGLKKRLQEAFRVVDFDVDIADAQAVLEQKRLLLATGITSAQADAIWVNMLNWNSKYGEFTRGVDQLNTETILAVNKKTSQDRSESFDFTGLKNERDQMEWAKLIEGRDADDNPIYTAEGKRRLQQLDGVMVDFEKDGVDADGNPLWKIKSFNRFEDYVQKELIAKYTKAFNENQQQALADMEAEIEKQIEMRKGNPKDVSDYLKDEIEKQIMSIYGTGDASRAPGNQMASYRLYSLIGHLQGESDFKTKWMARLAIYDVKMFMSGVENYEEWAKVNSFLPIEFREYLHHDNMTIGMIIDQNGVEKELNFNFADIYTMYEEQDGSGDGTEVRDIWIARILGAKNMDDFALAKRQVMAAYLGKQLGIEFKFEEVNGQEMFRQVGNEKLRFGGKDVSLLELVGLSDNGLRLPEDLRGEVDLQAQYGWYMDMPIDMGHLERRWVGLERGGNGGDWWTFGINGLRKLHGLAQVEYHKKKQMSMESAVDEMDSGWRSFLGWKLFETHRGVDKKVFWQAVEEKVQQGGMGGKKKEFFEFMKQAVYLPEYWANGTVAGELRSIAEIRALTGGELDKVLAKYTMFDSNNTFDWRSILQQMNVEVPAGTNVRGQVGMQMMLKNFNLHRLISYDGIPHNLIADDIKYTGYAEGYWKASVKAGDYIWDTKVQFELVNAIKSYHGKKGGEWKSNQLFNRQVLKGAMSNWEGQETYMDEDGKEATILWKIVGQSPTERAQVAAKGWRIDKNGYVLDENNVYQYRPGKIGYWEGFLDPNKPWSKGSAAGRHGNQVSNWKTSKEILKGYLKSRMVTPEQYWVMNKRFKYAMYFDADIAWNQEPTIGAVLDTLRKKPWKIAMLPYNVLKGLAVDLGLESEDWIPFFSPLGKEVGKQFSNII